MRRSLSWLGALALACVGCAHIEARDHFERSFEQSVEGPVARLDLDNSSGFVRVRGIPGARISVKGRISAYAGSQEKARELAERIAQTPPVERSGDVLYVGRHLDLRSSLFQGVSIDYDVVVPPELAASINNSSGDVEVDGLQGAVKVDSSSGSVKLRQVGPAQVDSSSGSVTVVQAPSAKVNSSSGDVVLEQVPGDIVVDSSSGDVDIHATPAPGARWSVDASSGDVTLTVSPHAAFRLDAETSSGRVKSELPVRVQGTFDSDELHGKVGEGPSEAEVKLSTSSGDVSIRQEGHAAPEPSKSAPEAHAGR